jgi:hypothetical protein
MRCDFIYTGRQEGSRFIHRCQRCNVERLSNYAEPNLKAQCAVAPQPPSLVQRIRATAPAPDTPAIPNGPGTELKKLLAELGVTGFKGCGCNDKAAQMNRWGVEGCLANFDTIRDWISEAQAAAGWATKITAAVKAAVSGLPINPADIAGSLVRIAIERVSK